MSNIALHLISFSCGASVAALGFEFFYARPMKRRMTEALSGWSEALEALQESLVKIAASEVKYNWCMGEMQLAKLESKQPKKRI